MRWQLTIPWTSVRRKFWNIWDSLSLEERESIELKTEQRHNYEANSRYKKND